MSQTDSDAYDAELNELCKAQQLLQDMKHLIAQRAASDDIPSIMIYISRLRSHLSRIACSDPSAATPISPYVATPTSRMLAEELRGRVDSHMLSLHGALQERAHFQKAAQEQRELCDLTPEAIETQAELIPLPDFLSECGPSPDSHTLVMHRLRHEQTHREQLLQREKRARELRSKLQERVGHRQATLANLERSLQPLTRAIDLAKQAVHADDYDRRMRTHRLVSRSHEGLSSAALDAPTPARPDHDIRALPAFPVDNKELVARLPASLHTLYMSVLSCAPLMGLHIALTDAPEPVAEPVAEPAEGVLEVPVEYAPVRVQVLARGARLTFRFAPQLAVVFMEAELVPAADNHAPEALTPAQAASFAQTYPAPAASSPLVSAAHVARSLGIQPIAYDPTQPEAASAPAPARVVFRGQRGVCAQWLQLLCGVPVPAPACVVEHVAVDPAHNAAAFARDHDALHRAARRAATADSASTMADAEPASTGAIPISWFDALRRIFARAVALGFQRTAVQALARCAPAALGDDALEAAYHARYRQALLGAADGDASSAPVLSVSQPTAVPRGGGSEQFAAHLCDTLLLAPSASTLRLLQQRLQQVATALHAPSGPAPSARVTLDAVEELDAAAFPAQLPAGVDPALSTLTRATVSCADDAGAGKTLGVYVLSPPSFPLVPPLVALRWLHHPAFATAAPLATKTLVEAEAGLLRCFDAMEPNIRMIILATGCVHVEHWVTQVVARNIANW